VAITPGCGLGHYYQLQVAQLGFARHDVLRQIRGGTLPSHCLKLREFCPLEHALRVAAARAPMLGMLVRSSGLCA
jgi:hypothetical protein